MSFSCRQDLLLLALCAWLLLPVAVHAVALGRSEATLQDESPTAENITAPASSNCTSNRTSRTERTFLERKQAMVKSVRQHMLAKLNLNEAPRSLASNPLSPAQLAQYESLIQALQQDDSSPDCAAAKEETTHFSKHLRLYHPELFVPTQPPDLFHLENDSADDDGKGEEIKEPSKPQAGIKGSSSSIGKDKEEDDSAPLWYSLRFDEVDLSNLDRVWSVQLQLYSRKAEGKHLKRGRNPVENVKVYGVVRRYAYGKVRKYHQLLTSMYIPSDVEGYASFNLTDGIREWMRNSSSQQTSLDLSIHVDTPEIADTREPFPAAIVFDVLSQNSRDPQDARLVVERLNEKEKVHAQDKLARRRKRQTVEGVNSEYCLDNPNETNCCIRELSVNFHEDLGWDWVVYPETFKPNYCNGQCVEPRWPTATLSTSFLIKLRESNPTAAPEPCCVPHKMRSLKVLMVLNRELVLYEIPDMITDSCICR